MLVFEFGMLIIDWSVECMNPGMIPYEMLVYHLKIWREKRYNKD
jgi:hypothetical protein